MKKKILTIIGSVLIVIIGLYLYYNEDEETIIKPIEEEVVIEKEDPRCFVDVKGEVVNPGVYECVNNNKVIDIINMAGGLTSNAETSIINLSKEVENEMLIIVYSRKQIEDAIKRLNEPTVIEVIREIEKECTCPDNVNDACEFTDIVDETDSVNQDDTNKLININTANHTELMTLPKIGESKAKAIIDYRVINKFEKIEEIMDVTGIGESIFNDIKDLIEV